MWRALHAGSVGLGVHFNTHEALLRHIRHRATPQRLRTLTWNREPLSEQQVTEVTQALAHLHCGNGYLTSAQDPLLCAFCAAFSVSVVHAFVRSTFVYEVKAPRRAVRLVSSATHMEHEANMEAAGTMSACLEAAREAACGDARTSDSE